MRSLQALVADGAGLVDAATGRVLAGPVLDAVITQRAEEIAALPPGIQFQLVERSVDGVLAVLGALASQRPVVLLDPATGRSALERLVDTFAPVLVTGVDSLGAAPAGYESSTVLGAGWLRREPVEHLPHPALALLLATSGSDGAPKLVRLSGTAVLSNARGIAAALDIEPRHRAVTCLPLHYSYGLSLLTSHLAAGATVVVAEAGPLDRHLWKVVDDHAVTSVAGVPFHWEQLLRWGWTPSRHRSLRVSTQAGGRLAADRVAALVHGAGASGNRFHVMYGQTEATARMSVVPWEEMASRPGSVGRPLPDGHFSFEDKNGRAAGRGEVVYSGPNVMLGYAAVARDLATGDELGGRLRTGDVGRLDEAGHLHLEGRRSRDAKIFGVRFNLDDVERRLGPGCYAVAGHDRVQVVVGPADREGREELLERVAATAATLRVNPTGFEIVEMETVPRLPSGKVDHQALTHELQGLERA